MLSTPHLRDLSVIGDQGMLKVILAIFQCCIRLAFPDIIPYLCTTSDIFPESIRAVVLHEVFMPMELSIVQISSNCHLSSWIGEYTDTFRLLIAIFDLSASHQPTLNFLCSSHIPMIYQSLFSQVEHERNNSFIIWLMSSTISKWKSNGSKTWRRGRILLQTLEQEGVRDEIELTLQQEKSSKSGKDVMTDSLWLINRLGMNSPLPE
ncbi:hypothetical protein BLNAU_22500 [Blattamonas nauphoetae]|uniref:Uncharacterized protein n=1 Tax=Blattamonas nauphoetae TaxID=2049346 RepID=A0ABQ9WTD4_9EUKA|nr:hypothetical protein BLNAU_22500 [Blattamonas nauphoetae]